MNLEQMISEAISEYGERIVLDALADEFKFLSQVYWNQGSPRMSRRYMDVANAILELEDEHFPNPVPDYIPPQGT